MAMQVDRVKKAYGMLAFIAGGIEYKSGNYDVAPRTSVSPHWGYCVHYRKHEETLERVQRFTGTLPGLEFQPQGAVG